MNKKLEQIIKYNSEGFNLDFKKKEYGLGNNFSKNEILKDISAFANHHSNSDKFIIIGVKEENGVAKSFYNIETITDEASYQQFIFDNIEPKINFEYKSIIYNDMKLAYFRIFNNLSRPYLFKKNIQNPKNKKIEYKIGDGFIKIGSSSKKMDRNDFEDIYQDRFSKKDRKDDLEIEAYFSTTDDNIISDFDVRYIDVKIINKSNKSINFDVEMEVYGKKEHRLISKKDLVLELQKNKQKENTGFRFDVQIKQPYIDFHINFKEKDDFIIISRNNIHRHTAAVSISQNSYETDVFNEYLFVLNKETNQINAKIIIRSDDFTEGPIIKELTFNNNK